MTPGLLNSLPILQLIINQNFYPIEISSKKLKMQQSPNSYSTKFCECENNCKKTWDLIKHLLNENNCHPPLSTFYDSDGQPITSPAKAANSFKAYFSNIGDELKKIAPRYRNHHEHPKNPVPKSMFFVKCHSTYMPISLLNSKISDTLDQGQLTIGICYRDLCQVLFYSWFRLMICAILPKFWGFHCLPMIHVCLYLAVTLYL